MNDIFCPSVRLSHLFDFVPIIVSSWKFQELLPMTRLRSMQKVKARGQRPRSQRTQSNRFRTVTPVWIHIWWWNDAYSLMLLRRGALLFFKVTRLKKSSILTQNGRFWTVTPVWIHQWLRNDAHMIEVELKRCPIIFQCNQSNVKVTRLKKIVDFDPNWAFPSCSSSLNSPMATKWCTKLEVAEKTCPIVFQDHASNCNVTRLKQNRRFWPKLGVSGL